MAGPRKMAFLSYMDPFQALSINIKAIKTMLTLTSFK